MCKLNYGVGQFFEETNHQVSEVELEKLEENLAHFVVEFTAGDVEKKFKDVFRYYSKRLNVPGFRKGKIPPKIIETRVGTSAIIDVVTEELKDSAVKLAIKDSELIPRRGDIRWDSGGKVLRGEALTIKFALPVIPEVNLPNLDGAEVVFAPETATDELRERRLADLLQRFAAYEKLPENEGVESGIRVEIAFSSKFADSGEHAGFESEKVVYALGLPDNLPGFDGNLAGMKVGEEKSFEYTMPEDFIEEGVAGKKLQIDVTLSKAEKVVVPEADPEFIKEKFDLDTMEDFERHIGKLVEYEVDNLNLARKRELALEQVLAGTEVLITDDMVEPQVDSMVEERERLLRSRGRSLDEILQRDGKTIVDLRSEFRPQALKLIKRELVVAEVSQKYGIKVEDREILSEAIRVANRYQLKRKQARELLRNRQFVIHTHSKIVEAKVLDFLLGKVKFVEREDEGSAPLSEIAEAEVGGEE